MPRKRWVLKKSPASREAAAQCAQEYNTPPFATWLALSRGIAPEDLPGVLGAAPQPLPNPYDFPDMEEAVDRIEHAIERRERIIVFGDYDCDGVTATAAVYQYLLSRDAVVEAYIPERQREGYGLNMQAIEALHERDAKLVITVDNGSSAAREIERARALGMEVVVTDHHQVGEDLPVCAAVVNPHRHDCDLPFKEFTGVALAFFLICALEGCEPEELLPNWAEWVALGTVADVAPLLGANRTLVQAGLAALNEAPSIGLAALLRAANQTKRPLGGSVLGYTIGPRINAAGRMGQASEALQLLLCQSEAEADRLAAQLCLYNEERQSTEQDILLQATQWLEANPARRHDRIMLLAGEGWHEGVIGIVASRLVERLGKPCLLLAVNGETAKGSGRSLPGLHLFRAIHHCKGFLQKYGGHELAAGFSLPTANIEAFRQALQEYAAAQEPVVPLCHIDARLNPAMLRPELADEIACLAPFGQGNPTPVFAMQKLSLQAVVPVGENRHLRLHLSSGAQSIRCMAFHQTAETFPFEPGDAIDIAVELEASEYHGERGVTLKLKEARLAGLPSDALLQAEQWVQQALRREPRLPAQAAPITPTRELAALVFRHIKKSTVPCTPERLCVAEGAQTAPHIAQLWLAAEILVELGVLQLQGEGYQIAPQSTKAEWSAAPLAQYLQGCATAATPGTPPEGAMAP